MHPISDLLSISMNSLNQMIDANTIIGTPLNYNNIIIIPVSRVHLGFVSGGSDIKPNSNKEDPLFGGGTGGGLSINPIAFLVINDKDVNLVSIDSNTHVMDNIIELIPKLMDKAKCLFKNNVE